MTDRPRVVVSVTASVDGRVTVGRDRLLLSEEAGSMWRSIRPAGADAVAAARTALLEELYAPTAILEGSGTFVTADVGPLDLPAADDDGLFEDYLPASVELRTTGSGSPWSTAEVGSQWDDEGRRRDRSPTPRRPRHPAAYLAYLRRETIPYLVAGEDRVDLSLALQRMRDVSRRHLRHLGSRRRAERRPAPSRPDRRTPPHPPARRHRRRGGPHQSSTAPNSSPTPSPPPYTSSPTPPPPTASCASATRSSGDARRAGASSCMDLLDCPRA